MENPHELKRLQISVSSARTVMRHKSLLPKAVGEIHAASATRAGIPEQRKPTDDSAESCLVALQESVDRIRMQADSQRLPSIIEAIGRAMLSDFELRDRPRYERLLRAIRGEGIPLAALSVCGRGTREIRYTQLLRYFLDPNEPHGLGSRVLAAAVGPQFVESRRDVDNPNWDTARVDAEYPLGEIESSKGKIIACVVDLLIQLGNHVVLIEHKVNSPESGVIASGEASQLKRYSLALEKNLPHLASRDVVKILLTPEGRAPREDMDWLPLSHQQLVDRISLLLDDRSLSVVSRHNLCSFLWDLLSGPLAVDQAKRAELSKRLSEIMQDSRRYLTFRRWCTEHMPNLRHLVRIVEVCYE